MAEARSDGDPHLIDPRGATGQMDWSELPRHLAGRFATIQWGADKTIPELLSEGSTPPDAPQDNLCERGEILDGTYEIRTPLGAGGMGQVYEARDLALNRMVAVKLAWPHVGPEPLRREAQVLAAFRHAGLATVHALVNRDGREFLVMERLTGAPLSEVLARRGLAPLAVDEALDILTGLCDALQPVHASGLAHADLKPANIMMVPGGRIVLLDFGIARIEQLRAGSQRVSGSPHYMAPETIRGAVEVGAAHLVDLYALGVIGYLLLTGEPPFDHPNTVELMMMHLHAPRPRPATRRPEVPDALDQLITDLLAKDASDRPADVDVVRAELRRLRARSR